MSKGNSGLFHGTTGDSLQNSAEKIIESRTMGLDLREHPVTQKQLSPAQKAKLQAKVRSRTATKEDYKALKWNKRFSKRRHTGVKNFWRQERARILNNQKPTRNWSAEQINEILHSRTPRFEGKAMEGHHAYSASRYPHLANRGEVIYPATHHEHHKGWHGGNYKESKPGSRIQKIEDF